MNNIDLLPKEKRIYNKYCGEVKEYDPNDTTQVDEPSRLSDTYHFIENGERLVYWKETIK